MKGLDIFEVLPSPEQVEGASYIKVPDDVLRNPIEAVKAALPFIQRMPCWIRMLVKEGALRAVKQGHFGWTPLQLGARDWGMLEYLCNMVADGITYDSEELAAFRKEQPEFVGLFAAVWPVLERVSHTGEFGSCSGSDDPMSSMPAMMAYEGLDEAKRFLAMLVGVDYQSQIESWPAIPSPPEAPPKQEEFNLDEFNAQFIEERSEKCKDYKVEYDDEVYGCVGVKVAYDSYEDDYYGVKVEAPSYEACEAKCPEVEIWEPQPATPDSLCGACEVEITPWAPIEVELDMGGANICQI